VYSKWERGDYLHKRLTELKKEIKILEPKKPDTDNLIVIGKNFQCKNKAKFIRLPVITITSDDNSKKLLNYPDERIALKIEDREFILERGRYFEKLTHDETIRLRQSKQDLNTNKYAYSVFDTNHVYKILLNKMKPIMWTINFEVEGDELCQRKFTLMNKGIQTISIDWRNVTPKSTSFTISNRIENFFYFNKNPISILPGQKAEVVIWFRSEQSTVASETWNLLIEPKIYPGILSLRLWGTSNGSDLKLREDKNSARIKNQLQRNVGYSIVQDVIENVFLASTSERTLKEIPYNKLFLETNIFHARNPAHFYNSILIIELKCLYKNAMDKEDWSLMLKELHMILLKLKDVKIRNQMILRFNDICNECLRPNVLYQPPIFPKRQLVYWLLCTFFNKFEDESNFIFNKCYNQIKYNDLYEDENVSEGEKNETEYSNTNVNLSLYYEVLYVRIYSLMCETVNRIYAAIDSEMYSNGRKMYSRSEL
jgi:hypothetical protein